MKRRTKRLSERKRRKSSAEYKKGGTKSPFARKSAWLRKYNRAQKADTPRLFGFQVASPKPWKGSV